MASANESLRRLAAEQRRTLYDGSMNLTQAAWETGDAPKAFELLRQWIPKPGEDDLRGFEWHYWDRLAHQDLKSVRLAGFDRDAMNESPPFLSPDGSRVAAFVPEAGGRSWRLTLWDAETGRVLRSVPTTAGFTNALFAAFSGDSRRFAAVRWPSRLRIKDSQIEVWDVATGEVVFPASPVGFPPVAPAFSADGSILALPRNATAGSESLPRFALVRLSDRKEIYRDPAGPSAAVLDYLAFSPDGRRLAALFMSESGGRTLRMHDLEGKQESWSVTIPETILTTAFRFNRDGSKILIRVSDGGDRILVRNAADGRAGPAVRLPNLTRGARYEGGAGVEVSPASSTQLAVPLGQDVYLFGLDPGGPTEAGATPRAPPGPRSVGRGRQLRADRVPAGFARQLGSGQALGSGRPPAPAEDTVQSEVQSGRRVRQHRRLARGVLALGSWWAVPDHRRVRAAHRPGGPAERSTLQPGLLRRRPLDRLPLGWAG